MRLVVLLSVLGAAVFCCRWTESTALGAPPASDPAAGGSCDSECDFCVCGTMYENNCPVDWFYDADCDCGCQFCDLGCFDCFMQDCGGGPSVGACCRTDLTCFNASQAACQSDGYVFRGNGSSCSQGCPCDNMSLPCEWCWVGTSAENNCPPAWNGTGDGCDCGCQWQDPDCGGGPEGACCCPDSSCYNGISQAECLSNLCAYRGDGSSCLQGCPCDDIPLPCDFCWIGTVAEDNCLPEWDGDGECDCGCQWEDPDCGGGCNPVCGDGVCECECDETAASCPADCVDVPCGGAAIDNVCVSDTREFCVGTIASCPCGAQCDLCWDGNCDPVWNGDGECDCGCQFCDVDCPEYPNCCIPGPASAYVYTDVFPSTCASMNPPAGWSQLDPGSGEYLFCSVYSAGACVDDVCVRYWLDNEGTCDPEFWLRFHQNDPAQCCACGNGACEPGCGEDCLTCRQDCGAVLPSIVQSDPPNCAIDARQPLRPNGTAPNGWDAIDIQFSGSLSCLLESDFEVYELGQASSPICGIDRMGDSATVHLCQRIALGAWTCLRYIPTGQHVCLSHQPGDVDNDGTCGMTDIPSLVANLEGDVQPPYSMWQCDVDRSGLCTAADILRLVDLLNGAEAYSAWLGEEVSMCPSGP